ncbi:MAG: hypothetical protein AMXMBFR61_24060 [Fimbriimonadales bacterium]
MPRSDRLHDFDFAAHNTEQARAWEAFCAGNPYRVPIILGVNSRYFMPIPEANPEAVDFRAYTENPDVMFDSLLRFQRWSRFNLLQDAELGLPDKWVIGLDFQNYYEAVWLGCPLYFADGEVPDSRPAFRDNPEALLERGIPDPFSGLMAKVLEYQEHFEHRAQNEDYLGRPIEVTPPWCGLGTDGPMTLCCSLFSADLTCTLLAEEPERMERLLTFVTDTILTKTVAFRKRYGVDLPMDNLMIADDSIALISTHMYKEMILPHHRRIYDTLATPVGRGIHLCGNATRHFRTLMDELGIVTFDTGFPVDFGALRRELGPRARIWGGPHIELLRTATPNEVRSEVQRILESGILDGGMFVLREGNNLAPHTPIENTEAMYHAGREFGVLS